MRSIISHWTAVHNDWQFYIYCAFFLNKLRRNEIKAQERGQRGATLGCASLASGLQAALYERISAK